MQKLFFKSLAKGYVLLKQTEHKEIFYFKKNILLLGWMLIMITGNIHSRFSRFCRHCTNSSSPDHLGIWRFNMEIYSVNLLRKSPYSVRIRENTDQKKLRIRTLFTQCWKEINLKIDLFATLPINSLQEAFKVTMQKFQEVLSKSYASSFAINELLLSKTILHFSTRETKPFRVLNSCRKSQRLGDEIEGDYLVLHQFFKDLWNYR